MEEIVLIDSKGNEQKYNILHTFGVDDYDYAVLTSKDTDSDDLHFFKINYLNDEEIALENVDFADDIDEIIEIYEELKLDK